MRQLSDIRRAAWAQSQAGRRPQALRAAVGGAHADIFDFAAMSRLVGARRAEGRIAAGTTPAHRMGAVDVVEPDLLPAPARRQRPTPLPLGFAFDNCAAAMEAFRSRLPAAAELVKAIAIAELEVAGRYVESEHDPVFEHYDEHSLTAEDLALLPDYLVCIPPERNDAPENAALLDMLSSAMPVKVLVQVSDLLEEASDRCRPLRLRRAQRAPGHHRHGPGRHVRDAVRQLGAVCRSASASRAAWPAADRRCSPSSPARRRRRPACRPT